ncbi:MAG: bifunctional oligoribonuclease/PAP phosphatase NrnA [Clostridia bacterium]|nr:bifunctional oligoribonuclease/PAP phosphatase NrnA [Clostridia bacterium]
MMSKRNLTDIVSAIHAAKTIALVSHVSPDGDTLGSALALRGGLEQLGKTVSHFCQDPVPRNLMMLKGADLVRVPESAAGESFDLLLCVDVSDEKRMGSCVMLRQQAAVTAQIDHHGTNPMYMERNVVDAAASATGLIAHELLQALSVQLNRDIATCLYVAISTDTGNFSYSNTTEEAFSVVSGLMAYGLPLAELTRTLFRERTKAAMLLLRRALNSMTFYADDRLAVMTLSLKDFEECGALPENADAIVNFGVEIQGVEMALLAKETAAGPIKMSLRAMAPRTVNDIASAFGGGGHAQASGCSVEGTLQQAAELVAQAMVEALNK